MFNILIFLLTITLILYCYKCEWYTIKSVVIMMVLLCSVLHLLVLQGVVGAKLGGGESCFEEG